mmetsp:Transcript_21674/g.51581  ORF Transcript_21674/g.51581 Transcript_21674/m.51581 type:complete len:217 (-) Transcript_21674:441-1091(-)
MGLTIILRRRTPWLCSAVCCRTNTCCRSPLRSDSFTSKTSAPMCIVMLPSDQVTSRALLTGFILPSAPRWFLHRITSLPPPLCSSAKVSGSLKNSLGSTLIEAGRRMYVSFSSGSGLGNVLSSILCTFAAAPGASLGSSSSDPKTSSNSFSMSSSPPQSTPSSSSPSPSPGTAASFAAASVSFSASGCSSSSSSHSTASSAASPSSSPSLSFGASS